VKFIQIKRLAKFLRLPSSYLFCSGKAWYSWKCLSKLLFIYELRVENHHQQKQLSCLMLNSKPVLAFLGRLGRRKGSKKRGVGKEG
jgi:hypothetical protein